MNYRVKTPTEEIRLAVQTYAFGLGYEWKSNVSADFFGNWDIGRLGRYNRKDFKYIFLIEENMIMLVETTKGLSKYLIGNPAIDINWIDLLRLPLNPNDD